MAAQESTVPMDDAALMQSALSPEPVREEPAPEPERTEQPRDEHGRFASKEPKADEPPAQQPEAQPQQAQPQQPTDDDKAGQVPSWRLREVREAREAAERRAEQEAQQRYALQQQLQQMQSELRQLKQPKQEPVNFFDNPDAALEQRLSPFEERLAQFEQRMRLSTSRAMAVATHGAQAVTEMEQAVDKAAASGNPEVQLLAAQMRASDDPVGVAMNWHKRSKLMEATGGDIEAFKARIAEDLLKNPEFMAKAMEAARAQAGGQSRPAIQLPPSITKAPGTGATESAGLTQADMSDAALYGYATARR